MKKGMNHLHNISVFESTNFIEFIPECNFLSVDTMMRYYMILNQGRRKIYWEKYIHSKGIMK